VVSRNANISASAWELELRCGIVKTMSHLSDNSAEKLIERPPIIVIMGHIDHGKSSLLDYIRKSKIVEGEAGSITQHLGAYEVVLPPKQKKAGTASGNDNSNSGDCRKITFLDTPGHAAFSAMRSRGAQVADLAILVVSAEDGVKPQTLEALSAITSAKLPYVVAITKIDKPNANIERVKQDLAANHVFLEGYGGSVPFTPVSSKSGAGIDELLEILLLVAEISELKADPDAGASGVVIESSTDNRHGCSATLVIRNGTIHVGDVLVVDRQATPVRALFNHLLHRISKATFSAPVRVSGCTSSLATGSVFHAYPNKKSAEATLVDQSPRLPVVSQASDRISSRSVVTKSILPVVLKADVSGSLEALSAEILKQSNDAIEVQIVQSGIGPVSENDLRAVSVDTEPLIIGFNVKTEKPSQTYAEQKLMKVYSFSVIYDAVDLVQAEIERRRPREEVEEVVGSLKVLKIFSRQKDKQVIGGAVVSGKLTEGAQIRVIRHDNFITNGKISELQAQKIRVKEVGVGSQCGLMVEAKHSIAPNDIIEAFVLSSK